MEEETLVVLLERAVRRNFDLPAFSAFPGPTLASSVVSNETATTDIYTE